jgi:hypothetical protein
MVTARALWSASPGARLVPSKAEHLALSAYGKKVAVATDTKHPFPDPTVA